MGKFYNIPIIVKAIRLLIDITYTFAWLYSGDHTLYKKADELKKLSEEMVKEVEDD